MVPTVHLNEVSVLWNINIQHFLFDLARISISFHPNGVSAL